MHPFAPKDASAAAIYGSRAAGGVILVTTKTGRYNTAPRVSFSARAGVRSLTDMYELPNTQDFIRVKQAMGEDDPYFRNPASLPYTDWPAEIYRNGIEHSYNLSLSGGSGKISYYLGGAYERENGTQLESWWERISARLNVDYAVHDAVTVGTRIYFARIRTNPYSLSFPWVSVPYISARNADLYIDWNIWDGLKLNITGAAHLGGGFDDNYSEANNFGRTPISDSYSKYLEYPEIIEFLGKQLGEEWVPLVNEGKNYVLRGKEAYEQINILGDDGVPVSYHDRYWKSELIDFVILQQDAFDKTDSLCPMNRQKYMFEKVMSICHKELEFDTFTECVDFYKQLINFFRQMNYCQFQDEKFKSYEQQVDALVAKQEEQGKTEVA